MFGELSRSESFNVTQHDAEQLSGIKSHPVSLFPAEANTVLNSELVGGLAGARQGGRVTAVFEAAQVPRHCREKRRERRDSVTQLRSISHADY